MLVKTLFFEGLIQGTQRLILDSLLFICSLTVCYFTEFAEFFSFADDTILRN